MVHSCVRVSLVGLTFFIKSTHQGAMPNTTPYGSLKTSAPPEAVIGIVPVMVGTLPAMSLIISIVQGKLMSLPIISGAPVS